jgi:hypothetical protein
MIKPYAPAGCHHHSWTREKSNSAYHVWRREGVDGKCEACRKPIGDDEIWRRLDEIAGGPPP